LDRTLAAKRLVSVLRVRGSTPWEYRCLERCSSRQPRGLVRRVERSVDSRLDDSSMEDMSVFVSFEWMLLVLASLSSPEVDDAVDEEKSRWLEPLISGAL
jgi:hypothetical protein